ncbi:MAG: nuclear transport factor 2 family protein [Chitinophagia bacterium]|jgi:hypothetical protein
MKQLKLTLVAFLSMLFLTASAQSKKELALNKALENFRIGLIDANESLLLSVTSPKLTYGHSAGLVEDQKTFVTNIVNGKSDFVSIDIVDQSIDMDQNIAYVRHTFNAVTSTDPKVAPIKLKILLVWEFQDNSWKLRARQAVKILI